MARFNFATALQNAISDPASYASFQKEASDRAFEQLYSKFNGQQFFEAVVLPKDLNSDVTDRNNGAIRVRPLNLEGFIIPEPCQTNCPAQAKMILALHPVAFPNPASPATVFPTIDVGQTITCGFFTPPEAQGKMRGIVYYPGTLSQGNQSGYDCLNGRASTGGGRGRRPRRRRSTGSPAEASAEAITRTENEIASLPYMTAGTGGESSSEIEWPKGEIKLNSGAKGFDWETLKALGQTDHFRILKEFIANYESGGDYDEFNLSPGGGGTLGDEPRKTTFKNIYGGPLTSLSLQTIVKYVQKKKVFINADGDPAYALAIGKYQIIPSTFRSLITKIRNINLNDKFNVETQEALGVYLYLMKKRHLGNYLMMKSDSLKKAQIALCQEWAGMRCAYDTVRQASTNPTWPRLQIRPGMSYYAGVRRNPRVDDIDISKANASTNALTSQRRYLSRTIKSDPALKTLLDNWKA